MDDDEDLGRLLDEFGIEPSPASERDWSKLDDVEELGEWNDEEG